MRACYNFPAHHDQNEFLCFELAVKVNQCCMFIIYYYQLSSNSQIFIHRSLLRHLPSQWQQGDFSISLHMTVCESERIISNVPPRSWDTIKLPRQESLLCALDVIAEDFLGSFGLNHSQPDNWTPLHNIEVSLGMFFPYWCCRVCFGKTQCSQCSQCSLD